MVEAVALLGGLLLLLDRRIPGPPRERSVVAYFRSRGGAQVRALPGVCQRPGLQSGRRVLSYDTRSPSC
jgi:Hereditary spastic paraplegia protein strumpellin